MNGRFAGVRLLPLGTVSKLSKCFLTAEEALVQFKKLQYASPNGIQSYSENQPPADIPLDESSGNAAPFMVPPNH